MAKRSPRFARGDTAQFAAVLSLCASVSCGSGSAPADSPSGTDGGAGKDASATNPEGADAAGSITETGILVDYESLKGVAGLSVTDNGVSTTTDAKGAFRLLVPSTSTVFAPLITGPKYTQLVFPGISPAGGTIDTGTNVIPDIATFGLEQSVLNNDTTKALVQIVVRTTGACTSAVGGTLQVLSPAGTSTRYFSNVNVPSSTLTSFQAVDGPRPLAVVYDIAVGSVLTVGVTHPTCKLAAFPTTNSGEVLTGVATTRATEAGDVNGSLVIVLE